jgi:ferredoxin
VYGVPGTEIATECGSSLAGAIVLVGAYASLTGLVSLDALIAGLAASLPERRRQHRELNERALRAGFATLPSGRASVAAGSCAQRAEGERSPSGGRGYERDRFPRHDHARGVALQGLRAVHPRVPAARAADVRDSQRQRLSDPELLPGCTGCGACLLVCPDFCFEIYQYEKPVIHEVTP